jgi:type I restriction enzyme R subunit
MVISPAQGEVKEFAKWDVDIVPHRALIKDGFETPDGRRVAVEDAFKNPDHPFRVAIVCAMWLTGFDVECLSTMYIDKPMKAHTLMQAIARPNRVFPGKKCGVIVDYNGILRSFRAALAQYATGDDQPDVGENPAQPIEVLVRAFEQAISEAENHLRGLGFDTARLAGTHGFDRIEALRDATEALKANDEAKRRFDVMARQVFALQKTLIVEPAARAFDERHDDIEAIYRKLQEHRDTTDVIGVLKELHRIVNEAIRTAQPGDEHVEALTIDLSKLDFDKLREEFKQKVRRKNTALQDIRDVVEKKLQQMLARNPLRMDYYKRYAEIIAEYNREKDRVTVEQTFARLAELAASLDEEEKRAAMEGLTEDELAVFDLLYRESISKAERERLKQASKSLLAALIKALEQMPHWTLNTQTQAQVEVLIRNQLYRDLPVPPFTVESKLSATKRVYEFVFQRSTAGDFPEAVRAA